MLALEGNLLNLWSLCREGTRALGPGLRYAIWTQGCLKRCPGCISPESRPIKPRMIVKVEDLVCDILSRPLLQGITISGGEPFLQAASLANMLQKVRRQRSEINVITFTGYLMEELLWDDAKSLLAQTDVLIDGPYRHDMPASKGLRGSLNQRFHFLTVALEDCMDELINGCRRQEMIIGAKEIVSIGIPTEAVEHSMTNPLYE